MRRILFSFLVCILFMVGCAPTTPVAVATVTTSLTPSPTPSPTRTRPPTRTPTPSITPLPTFTASLTSTSQPPLTTQTWKPDPILISMFTQFGFYGIGCPPKPPFFILYGDGTLIVNSAVEIDNSMSFRYIYKKLNQTEMCKLLNTIDQSGFLDFNPDSYLVNLQWDTHMWNINVHAWKNKEASLFALGNVVDVLERDSEFPHGLAIPPSVINTYMLLSNYSTDNFSVYSPNSLAIWIWRPTNDYVSKDWTIKNISLAQLYQKAGSPVDKLSEPVIVNGQEADDVYKMFNYSTYEGQVVEGDEAYQIYVRPVLPFEKISGEISTISPTSAQLKLPSTMQCSPFDGVMPIPTLTNP